MADGIYEIDDDEAGTLVHEQVGRMIEHLDHRGHPLSVMAAAEFVVLIMRSNAEHSDIIDDPERARKVALTWARERFEAGLLKVEARQSEREAADRKRQ